MGRPKIIADKDLLACARAVFMRQGPAAPTRAIAAAAGISEAAVFKRFASKSALYLAAMTPPPVAPDDLIADEIDDVRAALIETANRLLAYFRDVIPPVMQLATHRGGGLAGIASQFAPERSEAVATALLGFLERRRATGDIDSPDVAATAQLLIAAIHSLASFEILGLHGGADLSPAIPGFIDQLWAGIAPRGRRRPRQKGAHP